MEYTFVTITGVKNYYGMKPFKVGKIFRIVKEDDNEYDEEAIRAELPMIDTIGYVANSANTVFAGTVSAGRLYDKIDDYAYAQTMFITHSSVIALVLSPEQVEGDDDTSPVKETDAGNSKPKTKAKNRVLRGAEYVVIYIIVGFISFLQSVDQRIVINIFCR